ncbi:hypothetical protein J437_LFUL002583 [Ladona fulva]|uniref:Uncharacterized protein n=1 Tax=Ladona fulva TaxID=123851 RepID=A0A8K0NUP0_LADFU|nr:hypothetical protein J437_LFUL002583 [Ladona fulva]
MDEIHNCDDKVEYSIPSISKCTRPRRERKGRSPFPLPRDNPHEWNEKEKMALATALRKYGHLDAEKLQEEVQTKSLRQLQQFVHSALKKYKIHLANEAPQGKSVLKNSLICSKSSFDEWLRNFEEARVNSRDQFSKCLGKSMLFISRFEPHPDPKDCGGVDYAAIYEFLYQAVNGYPLRQMTPETAAVLSEELERIIKRMPGPNREKEREHLSKVRRLVFAEKASERHYGRMVDQSKPSGLIGNLLDVKGSNPLGIPWDLLKRPNQAL